MSRFSVWGFTLFLSFFYLIATAHASGKHVIGADGRQSMLSDAYPWSAIGQLKNNSGMCTASLVSKNLILTAAHCVVDSKTRQIHSSIMFYPNYKNGTSKDSARIIKTWIGSNNVHEGYADRADDWAIGLLDKNLGDANEFNYGFMGFAIINIMLPESFEHNLILAGYSNDYQNSKTAGVDEACAIRAYTMEGYFLHDCDTSPGASGSALFKWNDKEKLAEIVAVNVASTKKAPAKGAEYNSNTANIAVQVKKFANLLTELREQYK